MLTTLDPALARDIEFLRRLPSHPSDVWQAGYVPLERWVLDDRGEPIRVTVPLAVSVEAGNVGSGGTVPREQAQPARLIAALCDLA